MPGDSKPITIYVDADACPVKAEVYRVAERHRLKVYVVANSFVPEGKNDFVFNGSRPPRTTAGLLLRELGCGPRNARRAEPRRRESPLKA
jgi:hypothetical protein